jgi:hypothetical protein
MNLLGAHQSHEVKTQQIRDLTVREMLEKAYGEGPAGQFLSEIQKAFDSGARGPELKSRIDAIAANYSISTRDNVDNAVNAVATVTSIGAVALAV